MIALGGLLRKGGLMKLEELTLSLRVIKYLFHQNNQDFLIKRFYGFLSF